MVIEGIKDSDKCLNFERDTPFCNLTVCADFTNAE